MSLYSKGNYFNVMQKSFFLAQKFRQIKFKKKVKNKVKNQNKVKKKIKKKLRKVYLK
jgi:hypothetical protein